MIASIRTASRTGPTRSPVEGGASWTLALLYDGEDLVRVEGATGGCGQVRFSRDDYRGRAARQVTRILTDVVAEESLAR